MPKLHLKRTPEEEAAHQARKRRRKEKKADKRAQRAEKDDGDNHGRKWASSDEDTLDDDLKHRAKVDYEQIRAEIEEQRFREKMFDALGDDERLDSMEARFNDYAHVPDRWRSGGSSETGNKSSGDFYDIDTFLHLDPQSMDDEEYAEWVRLGMYRKTHAKEYEEKQRKEALKAERKAREKARREETRRLEKAREEERKRKKLEKLILKRHQAKADYETRWKELLDNRANEKANKLTIHDIPWPVFTMELDFTTPTSREGDAFIQHLTKEAITEFLMPKATKNLEKEQDPEAAEARKKTLRETILRYHPDKFEGRFMKLVVEKEKEAVQEAINQVFRCVNALMAEDAGA